MNHKLKTLTTAATGAVALVVMSVTPSQADTAHIYKNRHTGLCLAGKDRTVSQYDCSLAGTSSPRTGWTTSVVDPRYGFAMIRHEATGLCLDTNGSSVYLSGCSDQDLGQVWTFGSDGAMSPVAFGTRLTGWNDGGVSVRPAGDVDVVNKQKWDAV
ncbi:ricin-type beta-trefoil lectin domain protein [Streptomyces fumanus]|uniref:Ricin B lectin domain-containing protein n=1 Tax=Streptomyces fumanus TaxID=67302 RepID=A0A919AZC5_9ACTN|nr:ricin-type beta-trefoil lectin domain protein [Streptomyces fumanus]GHF34187.1 hypothetical protein GCM10018772_69790 [Streptomyces fumanus]